MAKRKNIQDMMYNEIKEMNAKLDRVLEKEIPDLKTDVKVLQVKSGVWGGLSGLIAAGLVAFGINK